MARKNNSKAALPTDRQLAIAETNKQVEFIVLFDEDGLVSTVRTRQFSDKKPHKVSDRTFVRSGRRDLLVEVVCAGDAEELKKFEEGWPVTHRAQAILMERIVRATKPEEILGGYLDVWPSDTMEHVPENDQPTMEDWLEEVPHVVEPPKKKKRLTNLAKNDEMTKQTVANGASADDNIIIEASMESGGVNMAPPLKTRNYMENLTNIQITEVNKKIAEFEKGKLPEDGRVCSGCLPQFHQLIDKMEQMAATQTVILQEIRSIKEQINQSIILDNLNITPTGTTFLADTDVLNNATVSVQDIQEVTADVPVIPVQRLVPRQVGVGTRREPMDIGSLKDACFNEQGCCNIPAYVVASVREKADDNICNFATTLFMAMYLPEELQGRAVEGNKDGKPPLSPRRREAIKVKTMDVYKVPQSEVTSKWRECKASVNKKIWRVFGKNPPILESPLHVAEL